MLVIECSFFFNANNTREADYRDWYTNNLIGSIGSWKYKDWLVVQYTKLGQCVYQKQTLE